MDKILRYMSDLEANNNREWYQANKERYREANAEFERLIQKLIDSIGKTDGGMLYGINVSPLTLQQFSAVGATLLTCAILTLSLIFTGCAVFLLNTAASRKFGIAVGGLLAFLPFLGGGMWSSPSSWWFMPTTWVNNYVMLQSGFMRYPPYWYAFTVLIAGSLCLAAGAYRVFRNRPIEVLPQL
jgi:hypothetical protein